ncbi:MULTISPECIES: TRAP transporter large permease subunit [unclassified Roseitalea]|uniref:TRAP transporter large permease n=1 Tax=unclassified Roseitalea TaxID=2639107 RepID=UPI00273E5DFE|nr:MULTISPECIES: TRAP transporter large permease subunit [unclassified Roseitalea]
MSVIIAVLVGLFAILLAGGLWIGLSMMATGIFGLAYFHSLPVDKVLAQNLFNTVSSTDLLALPLFILMAEVLFRTRISDHMFSGLAPWTTRLPGRLLHINIIASTLFAAVSGSSAATTATVGRITLSELDRRGYDRSLAVGSLAGASTIGFLIPPSLPMIVYGVLAEVSILKLFIAGIVPGLVLAFGFSLMTMALTLYRRTGDGGGDAFSWSDRIGSIRKLGPITALILLLIVGLYGGFASPTEAAAIGVVGAIGLAALGRDLSFRALNEAAVATVRTSSMLALITSGGAFLSVAFNYLGVPTYVVGLIDSADLGPYGVVVLLLVLYLVLGTILDGMSMIVVTLPITLPAVVSAGWDPLWFGVFLVVTIEMAQLTPPVGFNLFVIQGITGETMTRIARAVVPYFFVLLLLMAVLILAPGLTLWLPGMM